MKYLTLTCALLLSVASIAQTTIFSDDFDSYTSSSYLGPQSPDWTTWSGAEGGTEDGWVSTDESVSGSNSILIEGDVASGGPVDVFLPLPSIDPTMVYDINFSIYIPSGFGAYLNIQQTTNVGDAWVCDIYFPGIGNSTFQRNGNIEGSNSFSNDVWMDMSIKFDQEANTIEAFLDGNSYGVVPYSGSFGGVNFFAYAGGAGVLGKYYVDDFEIIESVPVIEPNTITPCEAGFADVYPCDKVDLLSILPIADMTGFGEANDIWGWTDPLDGKEYVIIGLTSGTAFIGIEDPINPEYLGFLPTHTSNSIWRDMKVYDNYAFIVSEAGGHGMQVFDLTRLRNVASPPETFTEDAHYNGFGNAHNIAINPNIAKAYVVGSNTFSGGLHIVDISDPLNPVIDGSYALDGYTHDAQIVQYSGPDTDYPNNVIAFNCNEDELTIADVTDPSDTQTISTTGYATNSYAHQGWLTEDQKYFLLGDEIDELDNNVPFTTTYIWDVQDLDAPVLIGTYSSGNDAIDHNLYVRGNLVFEANYRAGLRILDAQNVASASLSEVAYFDVYPSNNNTNFNGAWSSYPYFESNVIAVSHIEEGLFLLKPNFLNVVQDEVTSCNANDIVVDVVIEEGFGGPVTLSVNDLPSGATASFSSNNVDDDTTVQLTISNLIGNVGSFEITIEGDNGFFVFDDKFLVNLNESFEFYFDEDGDSFGDPENTIFDCTMPSGYVDNDLDCDDTNPDVYFGADGTGEDIDNNCDGIVDGDEVNTSTCVGDVNNDGMVNILDLVAVSSDFGCLSDCDADANFDGVVNILDLIAVSSAFGTICP